MLNSTLPEVVGTIVHYWIIIVVKVPRGFIIALGVEVPLFALPDVLVDDLDVLVPVGPAVLVVEAQGVHDLVQGPPGAAEAVAVLRVGLLQGELLAASLVADVGPTPARDNSWVKAMSEVVWCLMRFTENYIFKRTKSITHTLCCIISLLMSAYNDIENGKSPPLTILVSQKLQLRKIWFHRGHRSGPVMNEGWSEWRDLETQLVSNVRFYHPVNPQTRLARVQHISFHLYFFTGHH